MIYDLLAVLLFLVIILTSIMIIKNAKELIGNFNFKRGGFIKKLEKDTKDLSIDVFIKELEKVK